MTNSIDAVYRMFLAKVYRSISSDFTKEEMVDVAERFLEYCKKIASEKEWEEESSEF